jgi:hypothetical protein
MPLIKSSSKKAFKKNVETEMKSNPDPKDRAQNLAIAYSVKRKAKKKAAGGSVQSGSRDMNMAEGGEVNAKNERRPMPDNRYDDSKMVSRNSGNKPPKDDSWTSNVTIKQAQKPSITKLSQPRIVGSDAFSVRNRDMHEEEADLMDQDYPESDKAQPRQRYNEDGPNRQGPKVPDMERQHKAKKAAYEMAKEDQYSEDEAEDDMKKVQSPLGRYAKGGPVMEPEDHEIELRERSDEAHLQSMEEPSEDEGASDARSRNELHQEQTSGDPDMEDQHNSGRKPYYMGGPAVVEDEPHEMFNDNRDNEDHDMELNPAHGKYSKSGGMSQPEDEEQEERHNSIAAAIMAKRDRMHAEVDSGAYDLDHAVKMAEGGYLNGEDSIYSDDSSQVDLRRNAEEDKNLEDQSSFDAMRKENYSESAGLSKLNQPRNSNLKGDEEEDESENKHDMISSIRSKMNKHRQFPK